MGKNNYIVKCNQELAIFSNSEEKIIRTHDVKIPPILLDAISSTIKAQPDLENAAKDLSGLVEVDIGPFKEGLDSGELYRNSYELEIRDLKTGKYVGKAKLKEAELPETEIAKTQPASLSKITRSICSISGQLQMAEITQKLETIDKKLDLIREEAWRERLSNTRSLFRVTRDALDPLDSLAIDRINQNITQLDKMADFFLTSIEKTLDKNVPFSIWESFKEGLKFWELFKDRPEYNTKYVNSIRDQLEECAFFLNLYIETMILIGLCYQVLGYHNKGQEYYEEMKNSTARLSDELIKKLIFVLDINELSITTSLSMRDINNSLINRHIPVVDEVNNALLVTKKAEALYTTIQNNHIKLTMSPNRLLGGTDNGGKLQEL